LYEQRVPTNVDTLPKNQKPETKCPQVGQKKMNQRNPTRGSTCTHPKKPLKLNWGEKRKIRVQGNGRSSYP